MSKQYRNSLIREEQLVKLKTQLMCHLWTKWNFDQGSSGPTSKAVGMTSRSCYCAKFWSVLKISTRYTFQKINLIQGDLEILNVEWLLSELHSWITVHRRGCFGPQPNSTLWTPFLLWDILCLVLYCALPWFWLIVINSVEDLYIGSVVLTLDRALGSPGGVLNSDGWSPLLIQYLWGGVQESIPLTSSQMMLLLVRRETL